MKETYYFPHDYEPTSDPKMMALIGNHGAVGYGVYWRIIEMLHSDSNHKLPLEEYLYEALAKQMQADSKQVLQIINSCIKFKLFASDSASFWSERVSRNIQTREAKKTASQEAKRLAGKLGGIRSGEARRSKSKQIEANEAKERKVKERKVKENTEETPSSGELVGCQQNDDEFYRFSCRLAEVVLANSPADLQKFGSVENMAAQVNSWAADIRKIVEIDKITPKQLDYILSWLESGESWWTKTNNIRSGKKLREKVPNLISEIKEKKGGNGNYSVYISNH